MTQQAWYTWVWHSSHKSSTTHSYQHVQCFCVSRQWYGCQHVQCFCVSRQWYGCQRVQCFCVSRQWYGCQRVQCFCVSILSVFAVFLCVQTMVWLSVFAMFLCVHTMVWLPVFGIFNVCTDDACNSTQGCADTVRESALEADSGRKIPCHTGDSNPCQYCTWPSVRHSTHRAIPAQNIVCPANRQFKNNIYVQSLKIK